ncbi:MAG: hypothetical protein JWQ35_1469 [Bacteriovoracaceae bacterium]|nr:hypothetical protein [Bacteriovoracaceae bacterium]
MALHTQVFEPPEKSSSPFYQPIELDFIALDSICDHSLYLKLNGKYVLYRGAHTPFNSQDRDRLLQTKNKIIYIYCETERDLRHFYEQNLSNIIENKEIPVKKKAEVLYQCAKGIAHDIFENPENKESIGRSKIVVENTIRLLSQGTDAFLQIISLSSHDYYTYTHCVNVMAFSVGLLSSLGIKDQALLNEVGIGALLHDIGKAKVPHHVLNKPGPLNAEEWAVMKQHPALGFEMLFETPTPERSKSIVVQHHEKISGSGYPSGLKGESVPLISQVVSICDAYDAMTTTRVYKQGMSPFKAFGIITQEMKGAFDPNLISHFIKMLNLKDRK